jgi:CIC family chloride channel protein
MIMPGAPGFWALLGMAAMLGGTMRAPLTGAIFALELTGNVRMLAPLLASSTAAYAVTVLLHEALDPDREDRPARPTHHVMVRAVDTLSADMSIPDAVAVLAGGLHRVYPVVDGAGRPVGLVSRAEALLWRFEGGHDDERLGERISDASIPTVGPDDMTATAIECMLASDQGRIPVVDPATGVLVGLLTRKDLLQVRAAVARAEGERRAYFIPRSMARE